MWWKCVDSSFDSLQLLYQEPNPGIEYEYSFPKDVSLPQGDSYNWIYGSWSDCSATCGGGEYRKERFFIWNKNESI